VRPRFTRPSGTDYAIVTCDRYSAPQHGRLDCCSPAFVAIASGVQFWEIGLASKVMKIIISINE